MSGVQVQIVTYNSEDCIDRCLESVFAQTMPISTFLVLDNASQDDTMEHLKLYADHIECHQFKDNLGYAAAHNRGFQEALANKREYVITLNPDVVLDKHYIERCVQAMSDSQTGGVTGKLVRSHASDENGTPILDSTGLSMGILYHVHDRGSGQADVGQYDDYASVWGICGAAAVYRVNLLAKLDAFGEALDATFFVYKEDVDLCWRANRLGWSFVYAPRALAYHNRGWQRGREPVSQKVLSYSLANQFALLIRHGRAWSPMLWASAVVETLRLILLALKYPTAAKQTVQRMRSYFQHHWMVRRSLQRRSKQREEVQRDIDYYRNV